MRTGFINLNPLKPWIATTLVVGTLWVTGGFSPLHALERQNHLIQPYGNGIIKELSKNAPKDINTIANSTPSSLPSSGFALQELEEDHTPSGQAENKSEETPILRGNVTSLTVTRGRSQIVKFAQPIMRLSIANPQLADIIPLSPDQLMINGRQRGVTSLIVWDENGQEGIFDLHVQNDTTELMATINAIAPRENIDVRITDDSFLISGQVSSSVILDEIRRTAGAYGYRAENFVDLTETPIPQVVLEVKIVQMNKSTARDLRTSFATQGQDFTVTRLQSALDPTYVTALALGASSTLSPGTNIGTALAGAALNVDRSVRFLQQANNVGGLTGVMGFGNSLDAAFDFLQTNGKVSILAEPKLVATHGRTASFLSGGEFPFTSGTDQNGSPIISFREFGVGLEFTPWVNIRTGLIELRIAPEVSSIDTANCVPGAGGAQVCGLLKRTADSTVQLHDGETLMLGGILTREENNTFESVPFIGDLPILGKFFKNGAYRKLNTELVILVTPHVLDKSDFGKYFEKP